MNSVSDKFPGFIPDGKGGFFKPPKLPKNWGMLPGDKAFLKEKDLHNRIFDECRKRQWIAFHGSMAERTHRTEGEPDFLILCPSGKQLLVECKSRTGKLSPAQQAIKHHASMLGHTIHVVRSIEEFLTLVESEV
jgi:hypothetical protein